MQISKTGVNMLRLAGNQQNQLMRPITPTLSHGKVAQRANQLPEGKCVYGK
jgi:hypothetical protein